MSDTKWKAANEALAALNKSYGAGLVGLYGSKPVEGVEVIPSGSLVLDHMVLGCGGWPRGRICELIGAFSSGKTTLALHAIAECQKAGGIAAFVDAEHALDMKYAKALGVDVENLILSQPDYGEQALSVVEYLVRSGGVDLIVVDSVAALTPKAELDGEMGQSHVGLQARLMGQAMRKLTALVGKANCVVIFINQIREKVGIMYGSPETTPGGNALKFYASVRVDIRRKDSIGKGNDAIGNKVKVKTIKNKVSPPFREGEFDIIFGRGVHRLGELLTFAELANAVERKGAWYYYQGEQIGQGREKTLEYLEQDPQTAALIEAAVVEYLSNQ